MFKYGKWTGIKSSNNKNGISPWINITPDDFAKNAAGLTQLELTDESKNTWAKVKYEAITATKKDANGNDVKYVRGDAYFSFKGTYHVAEFKDYKALYDNSDIEQGFGVLYGDDSSATLTNLNDVYGYMADGDKAVDKGMRGCFVYNYRTGKNLFFPIGASGYGHRKDKQSDNNKKEYRGVLRYASSGRWGYFPSGILGDGKVYPEGIDACPLFFDIFRRPGAIYWFERPAEDSMESGFLVGWDFNYFTFDFFPLSEGNVANGADACFVRSIKQ